MTTSRMTSDVLSGNFVEVPRDWSSATADETADEIARLNRELCEATDDKIKAAQYGLIVLQQKERVQEENERIESLYDAARRDVEANEEVSLLLLSGVRLHYVCCCLLCGGVGWLLLCDNF